MSQLTTNNYKAIIIMQPNYATNYVEDMYLGIIDMKKHRMINRVQVEYKKNRLSSIERLKGEINQLAQEKIRKEAELQRLLNKDKRITSAYQ